MNNNLLRNGRYLCFKKDIEHGSVADAQAYVPNLSKEVSSKTTFTLQPVDKDAGI